MQNGSVVSIKKFICNFEDMIGSPKYSVVDIFM